MKHDLIKRILAVALSLTVGVTFIPLMGDFAFAEDEAADPSGVVLDEGAGDAEDGVVIDGEEIEGEDGQTDGEAPAITEENNTSEDVDVSADATGSEEQSEEQSAALDSDNDGAAHVKGITPGDLYAVAATRSGTTLTINASFKDHPAYATSDIDKNSLRFRKLYVDGYQVGDMFTYKKLENFQINISNNLTPGYHSVFLAVYGKRKNSSTLDFLGNTYAVYYRAGIMSAPSANGSLAIYHNYLDYMSPTDPNLFNYKLFLEYSRDGKTWATYGPMSYIQTYKLRGLKASKKYYVRSYYGVYRDGTWFTSKEEGKTRWIGTYRTGVAKRPAVKSITVKAYKVKKKKQRVYGYYTGLYLGKRTYYKYKLKIIVKLKKKPGNKIWINGKKFKGNRKTYTVKLGTFTSYSKPKGKKYKVMMYTYRNASWGGYSPMYKKTRKIK